MTMSKELYLEAIEALRQRVAAAGEGELEELPDSPLMDEVLDSVIDYIDLALASGTDSPEEFEAFLTGLQEELTGYNLATLAALVMARDRNLLMERVAERRRFFAEESAEEPPEDDDGRPDAPGADAWDWVAAGSDDVFWEDEDGEDDDPDHDDPDYDDAYGDDDADLLEDEKWQEADRRYEEDRLAELERLRGEIDEEEEEDYGDA
jgi:hypothetical protein